VTGGSASGSGNGTVSYTAAANTATTARTGTLTIAGQTFTVTQAAASCSYTVSPLTFSVGASGGTSTVSVTAASGCSWTAQSASTWVTVTPGAGGSGSGSVTFSTASNGSSTARTGSLAIGGQTINVSQAGMSNCSYTLSSSSRTINKKAANGSFTVTASTGCSWQATSSATWLSVTVNTSKGTVSWSALANSTGTLRSGTIAVNGVTFTLTQRGDTSLNTPTGVYVVSGGN